MIQALELKNFKSIKKHRFPLRNLNVALGLNGMGKSSFIQALLLLRQSDNLKRGELRLNGQLVEIGKGTDAFYQYSKEDHMIFAISFSGKLNKHFKFFYEKEADYFRTKNDIPDIIRDNILKAVQGQSGKGMIEDDDEQNGESNAVTSNTTGLLDYCKERASAKEQDEEKFFQQSLFGNKFQYLSASRIDPKVIHDKSYTTVVNLHNVGKHGQYTAHFLHVFGNDDIIFQNLKHPKSNTLLLIEQVNCWMGEMSTGIKFNTTEIPNSDNILLDMQFEQPNLGFTSRYRPTNVGFGISYVLPVVTALLASQPGELIIIENPESHIHPRGQAELGRLIAEVAMNDVQVIVETHSDHIINGIRVAVKEQDISDDRVMLFYFERKLEEKEQYSKITNIEVDRNGELSCYPDNLLDEWSRQLIKLV
jgi:predicted ATPase